MRGPVFHPSTEKRQLRKTDQQIAASGDTRGWQLAWGRPGFYGSAVTYFKDKDEIMAALVREGFQKLIEKLRPMTVDPSPIRDRVCRALRAYIEFGLENPNHYMVLFSTPPDSVPSEALVRVFHTDGFETFDCLRSMSREAMAAGELRLELTDVEEVAQTLWMGIHRAVSVRIGVKKFPFLEQERLTDRIVDVLLTGVLRPQ